MKHDEFVGHVQHNAHLASRGDAEMIIRATLETLGDNLVSSVLQHVTRGGRARLTIGADAAHVIVTLEDDGTPFGPVDRDFSREGQVAMKSHSDTRYTRGLGLYVIGLVVRANGV